MKLKVEVSDIGSNWVKLEEGKVLSTSCTGIASRVFNVLRTCTYLHLEVPSAHLETNPPLVASGALHCCLQSQSNRKCKSTEPKIRTGGFLTLQDAAMASDRIATAIEGLITHLVPPDASDTEDEVQERHDHCFELVRSIIDRYKSREKELSILLYSCL